MAEVVVSPVAREQIRDLPRPIVDRMLRLVERLVSKVKKVVKGKQVVEELVTRETKVIVETAGHRDGFYE